mmetsp:Transcript_44040/g.124659  ORF Transcript_44040/g.124659 Transcript_44040/m.124659 type:complete len:221 (-) Transcript_44040:527-1189(-)
MPSRQTPLEGSWSTSRPFGCTKKQPLRLHFRPNRQMVLWGSSSMLRPVGWTSMQSAFLQWRPYLQCSPLVPSPGNLPASTSAVSALGWWWPPPSRLSPPLPASPWWRSEVPFGPPRCRLASGGGGGILGGAPPRWCCDCPCGIPDWGTGTFVGMRPGGGGPDGGGGTPIGADGKYAGAPPCLGRANDEPAMCVAPISAWAIELPVMGCPCISGPCPCPHG